jgi:1-acyl-sn-glycerol-3-phosphate acyltransferase
MRTAIRTALAMVALLAGTLVFGSLVLIAQLFGVRQKPGSVYEKAQYWWGTLLLRAAGVRVVIHGDDPLPPGSPRVFVANHVSWFDIPVLLAALPSYGFVAKRELESVPFFGAAARAAGVIYIDRENRKAAFGAYEDAASKIRAGKSVLVYPEGTRGDSYALRPFKKGPFVLAIGSGAPVVPVVVHGTIEVNPRGALTATPGVVHVHRLEPVGTAGLTYDDRDALATTVHSRMSELLLREYGVASLPTGRLAPPATLPAPARAPGVSV